MSFVSYEAFKMNLKSLLPFILLFNSQCHFLVFSCLLIFSILFALRLDETINTSYWLVFMPLWIWKTLVIVGATIGTIVWSQSPEYRRTENSYIHYKSMLISLSLQLLLLMFELLICDKLDSGRHLWTLAFIPLLFISLLSIAICVWEFKNERSFEMEIFCAINILQFVFIALRLDNFIQWSWMIVFVPLWIVMCLFFVAVLYKFVFIRSPELTVEQRRGSMHTAMLYLLIVVPFSVFLLLLTNKLDSQAEFGLHLTPHGGHSHRITDRTLASSNNNEMSYFTISIPLYFTFAVLICFSPSGKGANLWWFGMRRDFCSYLLTMCPCLREYGNVSYYKHSNNNTNVENGQQSNQPAVNQQQVTDAKKKPSKAGYQLNQQKIVIAPIMTIETPD